jgi:hypothetical protein
MNVTDHFRPGDWATSVAALLLLGWLTATAWGSDAASRVIVRTGGKILIETNLGQDRRIEARGPLGTSVIEIASRRVRVAADPGPRQYCVKQGWLSRAGDAALCLPNQVSVELLGRSRHFDSLNY